MVGSAPNAVGTTTMPRSVTVSQPPAVTVPDKLAEVPLSTVDVPAVSVASWRATTV